MLVTIDAQKGVRTDRAANSDRYEAMNGMAESDYVKALKGGTHLATCLDLIDKVNKITSNTFHAQRSHQENVRGPIYIYNVEQSCRTLENVEQREYIAFGPHLTIAVPYNLNRGVVPGFDLGKTADSTRTRLTLHEQFEFLCNNEPDDMWRKGLGFINSIYNFGTIENVRQFRQLFAPESREYDRSAFWLRGWLMFYAKAELEVILREDDGRGGTVQWAHRGEEINCVVMRRDHPDATHTLNTMQGALARAGSVLVEESLDPRTAWIYWAMCHPAPFFRADYEATAYAGINDEKVATWASKVECPSTVNNSVVFYSNRLFNMMEAAGGVEDNGGINMTALPRWVETNLSAQDFKVGLMQLATLMLDEPQALVGWQLAMAASCGRLIGMPPVDMADPDVADWTNDFQTRDSSRRAKKKPSASTPFTQRDSALSQPTAPAAKRAKRKKAIKKTIAKQSSMKTRLPPNPALHRAAAELEKALKNLAGKKKDGKTSAAYRALLPIALVRTLVDMFPYLMGAKENAAASAEAWRVIAQVWLALLQRHNRHHDTHTVNLPDAIAEIAEGPLIWEDIRTAFPLYTQSVGMSASMGRVAPLQLARQVPLYRRAESDDNSDSNDNCPAPEDSPGEGGLTAALRGSAVAAVNGFYTPSYVVIPAERFRPPLLLPLSSAKIRGYAKGCGLGDWEVLSRLRVVDAVTYANVFCAMLATSRMEAMLAYGFDWETLLSQVPPPADAPPIPISQTFANMTMELLHEGDDFLTPSTHSDLTGVMSSCFYQQYGMPLLDEFTSCAFYTRRPDLSFVHWSHLLRVGCFHKRAHFIGPDETVPFSISLSVMNPILLNNDLIIPANFVERQSSPELTFAFGNVKNSNNVAPRIYSPSPYDCLALNILAAHIPETVEISEFHVVIKEVASGAIAVTQFENVLIERMMTQRGQATMWAVPGFFNEYDADLSVARRFEFQVNQRRFGEDFIHPSGASAFVDGNTLAAKRLIGLGPNIVGAPTCISDYSRGPTRIARTGGVLHAPPTTVERSAMENSLSSVQILVSMLKDAVSQQNEARLALTCDRTQNMMRPDAILPAAQHHVDRIAKDQDEARRKMVQAGSAAAAIAPERVSRPRGEVEEEAVGAGTEQDF